MSNPVIVEREGPVTIVTLNRPERRNAVDAPTGAALRAAFEGFARDGDARVAVLTGAGGVFCAGADLKAVAAGTGAYEPDGPGWMGPTRMDTGKPVIAAVEGPAVAGGLELALWADLRIASATALFGVFCRRWGVPLVDGGTVRLPRLIGHSRAMDLILTGRAVEAKEAFEIGLANRLAPAGGAREAAVALALQIARFPQDCLRIDRDSARGQWGLDEAEALRREGRGAGAAILAAAEAGAARFAAGRGRGGDFDDL